MSLFTVISATPTEDKLGFIVKLQTKEDKSISTPFGHKTSTVQSTYYMKLDTAPAIGFQAEFDIATMNVVEREFTIPDSGEIVQLKWLHIK